MPIVIKAGDGKQELKPTQFDSEDALEAAIAENPNLVQMDGEPNLALVARQVSLPNTGTLDVLLVNAKGKPIVVETKLLRNGQSRREVLAQAIDYVSALALLTVDEVDAAVGSKLEEAIRSLSSDPEQEDDFFETCWQACGTDLRAGTVTVVVAIDEAPEDLKRLMRYFSEHTDLDIRLISISKYVDKNGSVVLIPRAWVSGEEIEPVSRIGKRKPSTQPPMPEVQRVLDAYKAIGGIKPQKARRDYAYFIPADWPTWPQEGVHYEVGIEKDGTFGINVHIEDVDREAIKPLSILLKSLCPVLEQQLMVGVVWNSKWRAGRGCIDIKYPMDTEPTVIAKTLKRLVEETASPIKEELEKLAPQQPS